jgi:hypothetical protein
MAVAAVGTGAGWALNAALRAALYPEGDARPRRHSVVTADEPGRPGMDGLRGSWPGLVSGREHLEAGLVAVAAALVGTVRKAAPACCLRIISRMLRMINVRRYRCLG